MSSDLSKLLNRQITGKKLKALIDEQKRKIWKEQELLHNMQQKNPKDYIVIYMSNRDELEELQIHCKKKSLEKWLKKIIQSHNLSV